MSYRIELKPSAARAFAKLPKGVQRPLAETLDRLATEPRPHGVTKLSGERDLYRIRTGDYRLIYTIRDKVLLILVARIAHRREAYR
jgi:mRNA interferase RelE/StbE